VELNEKLLGGMGRSGFFARQIGGDESGRIGVIGSGGGGFQNGVVVLGVDRFRLLHRR